MAAHPKDGGPAKARDHWHLGAMNDGLFIINAPPSPAGTDVEPHVKENGPTLILNVTELPDKKAQAVVDAHNAELAAKKGEIERLREAIERVSAAASDEDLPPKLFDALTAAVNVARAHIEAQPISSRDLIKNCGGDPDAPFERGPFPPEERMMPIRVVDNDRDEITVTLGGEELRGWSYANEAERRAKMRMAREFAEGWYQRDKRAVQDPQPPSAVCPAQTDYAYRFGYAEASLKSIAEKLDRLSRYTAEWRRYTAQSPIRSDLNQLLGYVRQTIDELKALDRVDDDQEGGADG